MDTAEVTKNNDVLQSGKRKDDRGINSTELTAPSESQQHVGIRKPGIRSQFHVSTYFWLPLAVVTAYASPLLGAVQSD